MRAVALFLTKGIIAAVLVIAAFVWVANCYTLGYVDRYYKKFTTSAPSLVLGTSRAFQGINPDILRRKLSQKGDTVAPILNYAFSLNDSPYGPYYLESIKKKLLNTENGGIFILCVEPFAFSEDKNVGNEDIYNLKEASGVVAKINQVNQNPNYEYLFFYFDKSYYRLILDNNKEGKRNDKIYSNGWQENTLSMDSASVKTRKAFIVNMYRGWLRTDVVSRKRIEYFKKTIEFLKHRGKVYLVRLPVSKEMIAIENEFMPSFDDDMKKIAADFDIQFFNFIRSAKYITTDGTHLYKESGALVTSAIGDSILASNIHN